MAFFRCGWAKYDLAVPGTFHLSPIEERLSDLKTDYDVMSIMLFGDVPEFDDVLGAIQELEREINGLK